MKKPKKIFDSLFIGLVSGLLIPLVTIFLFYSSKDVYGVQTFEGFIKYTISYQIVSQVLSVCLLGNLAIFFLFIWSHRYRAGKGVIYATMIYGFGILIYKFFLI